MYHLHGFLRFDSRAGDHASEAPDLVVLTEQDYFNVFNDPTSIFTYTVLHLLRESSMLFIGLSMSDENLRRLLHYSRKERIQGYLAEGDEGRADRERKRPRHFAVMETPTDSAAHDAIESALKALGVAVLWLSDYRDIPDRLGDVYKAGGGNWHDVY